MNNDTQLRLQHLLRLTRTLAAALISVAFPYYILTELHYSAFTLGILYSAATIATALLALLFGYLADVWGRKGTLVLTGILLPLGAVLAFWSGHLAVLFAAAMLGGFSATGARASGGAGGAGQPPHNAALSDLTTTENRTHYFSQFTFFSGLFGAGGMLLARVLGGRMAFLAAAIVSAAGIPFIFMMKFPGQKRDDRLHANSRKVIG